VRRPDDLERLIRLRGVRLDRAARALAEQGAAVASAEAQLQDATSAAVANADRRAGRENALFERLAMRPLGPDEIGRAHDQLDELERRSQALDAAEQEALRALDAERGRRAECVAERLRLERERDKLQAVARNRLATACRQAELLAELDADGEPRLGRAMVRRSVRR
jgi:hypothetical protein